MREGRKGERKRRGREKRRGGGRRGKVEGNREGREERRRETRRDRLTFIVYCCFTIKCCCKPTGLSLSRFYSF